MLRLVRYEIERFEQLVGDPVCHRGISTGRSCGEITSKTYKPTYGGACGGQTCDSSYFTIEGPNLRCWPGDSGGPVFKERDAYGSYMAQSASSTQAGDCHLLVYMEIGEINGYPADLGVLRDP